MGIIILTDKKAPQPLVKNEHIVSRFYLNRFADAQKQIVVYTNGGSPRPKSTKSQSAEDNYFEYTINGEATENCYEKWFGAIENDAAVAYDALHSGQQLTPIQEQVFATFVAMLFLRSRKVREQIGPALTEQVEAETFYGEEQIREMQYEYFKQGTLVTADELRAKVSQIKREMRAPAFAHLAGIEENVHTLANDIFQKQWFVFEAGGSEFITSDCPVQTVNLNAKGIDALGSGFGHASTAIILPLSPTKLFMAGPKVRFKSNVFADVDVMRFNLTTIQFADRAVYSRHKLNDIQALVDKEINQVTYGKNAFLPKPKGTTPE